MKDGVNVGAVGFNDGGEDDAGGNNGADAGTGEVAGAEWKPLVAGGVVPNGDRVGFSPKGAGAGEPLASCGFGCVCIKGFGDKVCVDEKALKGVVAPNGLDAELAGDFVVSPKTLFAWGSVLAPNIEDAFPVPNTFGTEDKFANADFTGAAGASGGD